MEKNYNINVQMNGQEYIDYVEKRRLKFPKMTQRNMGILIIILSLCGLLLIPLIIEGFAPPPKPYEWGYSNLWGVTVHNGLIVWIGFSMGIAWVLHGFGFILVRR